MGLILPALKLVEHIRKDLDPTTQATLIVTRQFFVATLMNFCGFDYLGAYPYCLMLRSDHTYNTLVPVSGCDSNVPVGVRQAGVRYRASSHPAQQTAYSDN